MVLLAPVYIIPDVRFVWDDTMSGACTVSSGLVPSLPTNRNDEKDGTKKFYTSTENIKILKNKKKNTSEPHCRLELHNEILY